MNTTQATATYETDIMTVEVTMDVDLYFTSAEPDVGYVGGCEADGHTVTEVSVYFYTDEEQTEEGYVEWTSTDAQGAELALVIVNASQGPEFAKGLEEEVEKAIDTAANDYEPDCDYCP